MAIRLLPERVDAGLRRGASFRTQAMRRTEQAIPSAGDVPPEPVGYESLEAMQEAASEAGWDLEYRQLAPGKLRARTQLGEVGGVLLSLEETSHRVEVVGGAPEALAVTIPCAGTHLSVNGQSVGDDRMFVTTPGAEIALTTSHEVAVISMHVPMSMFSEHTEGMWPDWERFAQRKAQNIQGGFEATESLRQRMYSQLRTSADQSRARERGGSLVTDLVSLLIGKEEGSDGVGLSPSTRWWVLNRAREYIEDHLTVSITMADLRRYTGASLSTIEKVFRHEILMPPTTYIRHRRLDAVRRQLASKDRDGETISRIASNLGFTHLGRFSLAYRELFGISPREERQAARERLVRSSVLVTAATHRGSPPL